MVSPMKGRRSLRKAEWYAGIDEALIQKIDDRVNRHIERGTVTPYGNPKTMSVYTHLSIDSVGVWKVAASRKGLYKSIGVYPDTSVEEAISRAGKLLFPAKKTPEQKAQDESVVLAAGLRENREKELEAIRRMENSPLANFLRENYSWHD